MTITRYRDTLSLIFIFFICCPDTTAQHDSSGKSTPGKQNIFSTGLGIEHGFIFAHSPEVENTAGSHPTGIVAIVSWQRNDASVWSLCNCYPRNGLMVAYHDFDNPILKRSYTAAYFLEPVYRLGKKIFFSFKGSAGFSYLTNPFDSIRNPTNKSYSTRLNTYLLIGFGLWFQLDRHWWLNPTINYEHESNGGLRQPNKGINWPAAGLTLSYQKPANYFTGPRSKEKFWISRSIRWDIGIFGIAKRVVENGNSKRRPLIGLSFQGSKQVGRLSALTGGTEIYVDNALRSKLRQDSISASPVRAAILAGHEFILGRFLFSQRLGFSVFDKTPYFDKIYHRWGIHYRVNRHVGIGWHLQAHRQVADFTDLRVTWSIQKKYQ